jgi:glycosyltransferase involved in cell wall biosynthesis
MTYNEEVNIKRCLDAVAWSDDVVLLDSLSSDRTLELARHHSNVRVFSRPFDDYSKQRNYGLHEISYLNDWVLVVDADEVVEPMLAEEVLEIANHEIGSAHPAYLVRRKVFFDGRWVRRNVAYDFWIARLLRPDLVRYEGAVHERVCYEGVCGRLRGALEHHQFSKGVDDWLARRSRYARMEARDSRSRLGLDVRALISRDVLVRRRALKGIFYRVPARGLFYYLYNFIFKAAFLDGRRGLSYIYWEAYSHSFSLRQSREKTNA